MLTPDGFYDFVVGEFVMNQLGGESARWDALSDADKAGVLAVAIARRNPAGRVMSGTGLTPRDWIELHKAPETAKGPDVVGSYLGGG